MVYAVVENPSLLKSFTEDGEIELVMPLPKYTRPGLSPAFGGATRLLELAVSDFVQNAYVDALPPVGVHEGIAWFVAVTLFFTVSPPVPQ